MLLIYLLKLSSNIAVESCNNERKRQGFADQLIFDICSSDIFCIFDQLLKVESRACLHSIWLVRDLQ